MKKQTLLALALFLAALASAQQPSDVLLLKSGGVVQGIITEDFPGEYLKIKIGTGDTATEYTYPYSTLESITRNGETRRAVKPSDSPPKRPGTGSGTGLRLQDYGGQTAFGFGFGDGLIGSLRYCLSTKTALEAGIGFGTTIAPIENSFFEEDNPFNTETGIQLEAAVHLMGERKENRKGKIKANGVVLRAGHLLGNFATTSISAGYGVEVFNPKKKKPTRSYIFELGLKASFPQWETNTGGYGEPPAAIPYIRFRWFWYGRQAIPPSPSTLFDSRDEVQEPLDDPSPQDTLGRAAGGQPNSDGNTAHPSPSAMLKKGNIMLATSTGLMSSSASGARNAAGIALSEVDGTKTSLIGLTPNAGYFFCDNLLGGLGLSLVSSSEKESGEKRSSTLFSFGPFVRYYGDLPGNERLKWTAEAAIGFGSEKTKVKVGTQTFENVDGLFSLSLGPGVAYFLGERVTLEAAAIYERLSVKDKEDDTENSTGSFGLRVGFGVFL